MVRQARAPPPSSGLGPWAGSPTWSKCRLPVPQLGPRRHFQGAIAPATLEPPASSGGHVGSGMLDASAAHEEPRTRLGSRHPPCRLPVPQLAARAAWDARLRAWADARSGFGRHVPKSPISLPVTLQARARRRPSLSLSRSPSRSPDPKPSPDPDPSTDLDPKPKPTPKTNQARARRRPRCHLRAWPVERWRARKRARRWQRPKHQHLHRQCRSSPVR